MIQFVFCILMIFGQTACRAPSTDVHLIVISIDGMGPDYYLEADRYGLQIPTLRSLMGKGVYASSMETVYPSVTYPAHASLVTGALPAEHGIVANSYYFDGVRRPVVSGENYKTDPVWRVARTKALTTAGVFWPVTRDEPIDWLIPEIWWDGDKGNDAVRLRKEAEISTPGLIRELQEYIGPPLQKYFESDTVKTDATIYILKKYRPNLLFLHYSHLDYHQHVFGPGSQKAIETLEMQDRQISRIIEAVEEIGIIDNTIFMIVSDHGHAPVSWQINPGVLLNSKGLIEMDEAGAIMDWKAMMVPTGGSCSIILRREDDSESRESVLAIASQLTQEKGIKSRILPGQIKALGGDPKAVVMLEAEPGYSFGAGLSGPVIEPAAYRSTHGYLPTMPEMRAAFIAAGPGIKHIGEIGPIKITDIFPLIDRLFGLGLDKDSSLLGIIEEM